MIRITRDSRDFEGRVSSNGSQAKAVGSLTGDKPSPKGAPASKSVKIKYTVSAGKTDATGLLARRRP